MKKLLVYALIAFSHLIFLSCGQSGQSQSLLVIKEKDSAVIKVNSNEYYTLKYVSPGEFAMGETVEMKDIVGNSAHSHKVTLTKGYYIGETEVTNKLWEYIMNDSIINDSLPKTRVSWDQCREFVDKLNENYFKIKECLSRRGNKVYDLSKKDKID